LLLIEPHDQGRIAQRSRLCQEFPNPVVVLGGSPGCREQLVQALAELTTDHVAPPLILVTHHLDEIPPGMTHVLMLREGRVVASGPIGRVLTSANLSECFGVPLTLDRRDDGRFSAWSPRAPEAAHDPR